uniref:Uncharacterized protein n=1 Tax=Haptolina ericina TaxID=156174 RepID=A0A7S3EYA3_9EUKA|mmetsp:Transcript_32251/g.72753  ORF Transcript_32251/g.72753 Transcript_32251/m.72753 type:complete len:285 (+) Transcript_32251:45-899(+)
MPRGKAKATDDMKATEDLTFKEARVRVLDAERQSAAADRARALLDLEKQRISQLIDILSDFSTQASLLAGCAIAAVGGESLESVADEVSMNITIGTAIFVVLGGVAVASSIWVIFISSHLISLTRDAALKPRISHARGILEEGVRDVRGMLWLSLASLLSSTVTMAWLNASTLNASLFTAGMVLISWQALLKKDLVSAKFREDCGDEWTRDITFREMMASWFEPWRHSAIGRCCCGSPTGADEWRRQQLAKPRQHSHREYSQLSSQHADVTYRSEEGGVQQVMG